MSEERQEAPTTEPEAEKKTPINEFVSHQRKAADEMRQAVEALIPPDFRSHSRVAREEFLLSFKVLVEGLSSAVDQELNRVRNASPASGGPSTTGKTKVRVEVS